MRTIRSSQILFAMVSSIAALSACNAQEPAKPQAAQATTQAKPAANGPVATVNGVAIPQSRMELIVKERESQGQADSPEMRKNIREHLINREILSQEATKKGIDKSPEVAGQIEFIRQSVLVGAFLQDYQKSHPVTEAALKKDYELLKTRLGDKEYKARHILVEKEDEAKAIIAQIKKGAKFEKLAEKSKDTGSKTKGGELDWAPAARYVPSFAEALAKLQKGQMTQEPVQSQFGWHVIRLDDVRPLKAPTFEEVKSELEQYAQQQERDKLISDLRAKAKVE